MASPGLTRRPGAVPVPRPRAALVAADACRPSPGARICGGSRGVGSGVPGGAAVRRDHGFGPVVATARPALGGGSLARRRAPQAARARGATSSPPRRRPSGVASLPSRVSSLPLASILAGPPPESPASRLARVATEAGTGALLSSLSALGSLGPVAGPLALGLCVAAGEALPLLPTQPFLILSGALLGAKGGVALGTAFSLGGGAATYLLGAVWKDRLERAIRGEGEGGAAAEVGAKSRQGAMAGVAAGHETGAATPSSSPPPPSPSSTPSSTSPSSLSPASLLARLHATLPPDAPLLTQALAVVSLRAIPGMPSPVLNALLPLAGVRPLAFALGSLPWSLFSAVLYAPLGEVLVTMAQSGASPAEVGARLAAAAAAATQRLRGPLVAAAAAVAVVAAVRWAAWRWKAGAEEGKRAGGDGGEGEGKRAGGDGGEGEGKRAGGDGGEGEGKRAGGDGGEGEEGLEGGAKG